MFMLKSENMFKANRCKLFKQELPGLMNFVKLDPWQNKKPIHKFNSVKPGNYDLK